jgi:hypothetical protein
MPCFTTGVSLEAAGCMDRSRRTDPPLRIHGRRSHHSRIHIIAPHDGPAGCHQGPGATRRPKPLPALWRCDSAGITIEWGGVNERIEVKGTGEVTVRVSGTTMKGLSKAPWRESSLASWWTKTTCSSAAAV